ncbi:hypothetical protein DPMN_100043 [Dreissena polymorpha]|uniref:Uncharacterized protein n=1 Tax=Dreissena polymorpha TaxID=45954 RepID=A0A9D4LG39_DREPO|nr:hypothetical protein DPMN_100043 [Dreissena polymorpha]
METPTEPQPNNTDSDDSATSTYRKITESHVRFVKTEVHNLVREVQVTARIPRETDYVYKHYKGQTNSIYDDVCFNCKSNFCDTVYTNDVQCTYSPFCKSSFEAKQDSPFIFKNSRITDNFQTAEAHLNDHVPRRSKCPTLDITSTKASFSVKISAEGKPSNIHPQPH